MQFFLEAKPADSEDWAHEWLGPKSLIHSAVTAQEAGRWTRYSWNGKKFRRHLRTEEPAFGSYRIPPPSGVSPSEFLEGLNREFMTWVKRVTEGRVFQSDWGLNLRSTNGRYLLNCCNSIRNLLEGAGGTAYVEGIIAGAQIHNLIHRPMSERDGPLLGLATPMSDVADDVFDIMVGKRSVPSNEGANSGCRLSGQRVGRPAWVVE
jgi:hypothetical protein